MQIPTRTRPPLRWSPPPLPGDAMFAYRSSHHFQRTGGAEESFDRGQRRVVTTNRNIYNRCIPGRRRRPPRRSPCQPVMHSDRPWCWTHAAALPRRHRHQKHPELYDPPSFRRLKPAVYGAKAVQAATSALHVHRRTVAATPCLPRP
jgi:hypothetical protein